jgi:hypothetical protein
MPQSYTSIDLWGMLIALACHLTKKVNKALQTLITLLVPAKALLLFDLSFFASFMHFIQKEKTFEDACFDFLLHKH